MTVTQEYRIESFTKAAFIEMIQDFDYCKFILDGGIMYFAYRPSFPKFYYQIPVFNKNDPKKGFMYIEISKFEKNNDGTIKLSFNHYINFFSKFSIWTSKYSFSLLSFRDSDFLLIETQISV